MQMTYSFSSLFYPPDLHSSISHLQNALQQISSWMIANLLTLNSSKTEFLLIGLKQHLAKTQNSPLNTTHSPCNLASSLMNICLSLIKSLHFPSPATFTFVNSIVSAHSLISKQPAPLPPLSFTPKLDYCNSLYYNHPKSQLSRLQHIHNFLARVVVKTPKFSYITPILKSLYWLKVNAHIEYKILSHNCSTCLPP